MTLWVGVNYRYSRPSLIWVLVVEISSTLEAVLMNLELCQKRPFAGERSFRFKDSNTLLVTLKKLKKRREYLIDLAAIDPNDKTRFVFAKKPLIAFIIFFNISLVFYLTPLLSMLKLPNPDWYVSGSVILSLISLIVFISMTRLERFFISRHSKIPLLQFYNGLPNKKDFKKFTQYIQAQSKKRFEHLNLDLQQQYAGELKTLRRVHDEGAITVYQYEKAKKKLLKMSG